jgi:hypothetical protein
MIGAGPEETPNLSARPAPKFSENSSEMQGKTGRYAVEAGH